MKIFNFGSLNIDHVYQVDRFASPGETIAAKEYQQFAGGKGLNQSIALARAGATVVHAGKIGHDGTLLVDKLREAGVAVELIETGADPTGHAIVQVTPAGQNSIVVAGGANHSIDQVLIANVLDACGPGDLLLLQNEINSVEAILRAARERGIRVVFNPAPLTDDVRRMPLDAVHLLILNEVEATQLSGQSDDAAIIEWILRAHPKIHVVLTLGERGAVYAASEETIRQAAFNVTPVDTTAAGDTFLGFFLAAIAQQQSPANAVRVACKAASICITRRGAADSIPTVAEVQRDLG